MDSLNTDCLIEIFKRLSLKDQIQVHEVNTNLQVTVTTIWERKFKHLHINFLEWPLNNADYSIFFKSVQDIVEKFRFTLSRPYFMKDRDLFDLQRVLPNLEAFTPHGDLSGLYIGQWPLLRDLNLSHCFKIDMWHFRTILRQRKLEKLKLSIFPTSRECDFMDLTGVQLQNLKYLELNTYEFYYFLPKALKPLKELIISNRFAPRQLFDVILSVWEANEICLVETTNVDNIILSCIEMKMNIEQLSIVNDEYALPSVVISSIHLLTDLRILRFANCPIEAANFRNLLNNISQLREISFEGCEFDVATIFLTVVDICAKRKEKLRLNMFENRMKDSLDDPKWRLEMSEIFYVKVYLIGHHNLFELTNLRGSDLSYEPLYVVYR